MTSLDRRQKKIVEQIVRDIEARFPDVRFLDVVPSPDGSNTLWIEVTRPADEDREIELREYAAERSVDILIDTGLHILIQPTIDGAR